MAERFTDWRVSRREFGTLAGAAAAAGLTYSLVPGLPGIALAAEDSSQIIKGKVSGMVVHNAKLGVVNDEVGHRFH